jgi:hypothetical protein
MELFDQLRRSQVTVSTQDLTTALNWASVAQQQDAHEFMRVLFERIENELKKHDNIRSCVASRLRVRGGQQCRAFHDLRYVL